MLPPIELHPGPPLSHSINGSVSGRSLDVLSLTSIMECCDSVQNMYEDIWKVKVQVYQTVCEASTKNQLTFPSLRLWKNLFATILQPPRFLGCHGSDNADRGTWKITTSVVVILPGAF
ncbi:hypothetical protein AB6A40_010160 [Gnathostoma spinigerum]|uniref:Uncharacterized protein n=1 Tax=Gnathostoma spinigerum TaxID=75299 RepID=A0ABD6EUC3_9BILA